eukprot:1882714-Pleurochrysis_carterae.AAC.2
MEVAKLEKFTENEKAEREALFDFHETHQHVDSLPSLPHTIHTRDHREFKLNGMPVPWDQLWAKLAGRFPRPHHKTAEPEQHITTISATNAPPPAGAAAVTNNVTGINHLPAARQREVAANASNAHDCCGYAY